MLYRLSLAVVMLWQASTIDQQVQETCDFLNQKLLSGEFNPDPSLVLALSIGAPEYIRYRNLANLMEVQALRLMYAELGSSQIDFSVGLFQMKPSFIETLEVKIQNDDRLQNEFADLIGFHASDPSGIRQERIDRILNFGYCIRYLKAFEQIMRKEYAHDLKSFTDEETLHFLATAYNLGFGKSSDTIKGFQSKQNFPHGSRYQGEQFAFGDLSVRIYRQLNKLLCIPNH